MAGLLDGQLTDWRTGGWRLDGMVGSRYGKLASWQVFRMASKWAAGQGAGG
jgi:hypothetical protein